MCFTGVNSRCQQGYDPSRGFRRDCHSCFYRILEAIHIPQLLCPFFHLQSHQSIMFKNQSESSASLLTYKGPYDYIGPNQLVQHNLKFLNFITSAKSLLTSMVIFMGSRDQDVAKFGDHCLAHRRLLIHSVLTEHLLCAGLCSRQQESLRLMSLFRPILLQGGLSSPGLFPSQNVIYITQSSHCVTRVTVRCLSLSMNVRSAKFKQTYLYLVLDGIQ